MTRGAHGVGFCRRCRKSRISLTSKGNLWTHSKYSRADTGEYNTRCEGSGQPPHLVAAAPVDAPVSPAPTTQETVA